MTAGDGCGCGTGLEGGERLGQVRRGRGFDLEGGFGLGSKYEVEEIDGRIRTVDLLCCGDIRRHYANSV